MGYPLWTAPKSNQEIPKKLINLKIVVKESKKCCQEIQKKGWEIQKNCREIQQKLSKNTTKIVEKSKKVCLKSKFFWDFPRKDFGDLTWKVKFISFHSFREWKVKWKSFAIEIESEKWIENASRSRSEICREFSRNSWESKNQRNFQILLQILFL